MRKDKETHERFKEAIFQNPTHESDASAAVNHQKVRFLFSDRTRVFLRFIFSIQNLRKKFTHTGRLLIKNEFYYSYFRWSLCYADPTESDFPNNLSQKGLEYKIKMVIAKCIGVR